MPYSVTRYHDFSAGHRVVGHEGKCRFLHGHNYRIHFTCQATRLDTLGRVIDFGVIKSTLCQWLEDNWDHKMLIWYEDPLAYTATDLIGVPVHMINVLGMIRIPFNPTAENMAQYLVQIVGPKELAGTGVTLVRVVVDETRKCSASFECVNVGVIDDN